MKNYHTNNLAKDEMRETLEEAYPSFSYRAGHYACGSVLSFF